MEEESMTADASGMRAAIWARGFVERPVGIGPRDPRSSERVAASVVPVDGGLRVTA
ncbi:hypothetical protein [Alloactinosynnema sp. L-07]|nr:hypothetical protein [Alloactinosynnema sp. L-07]